MTSYPPVPAGHPAAGARAAHDRLRGRPSQQPEEERPPAAAPTSPRMIRTPSRAVRHGGLPERPSATSPGRGTHTRNPAATRSSHPARRGRRTTAGEHTRFMWIRKRYQEGRGHPKPESL
ncbi:hypothetical protein QJS66_10750 [Kocuria rhizophila]|nr:hypothetical protein QJS66_10750 [Kocuria rhizophila]